MRAQETTKHMAREMFAAFLQRISRPGSQAALAESIGMSDTAFSRFKTDQMETLFMALAAAGFKTVPANEQTYSPEQIQALLCLAKTGLENFPAPNNTTRD
jgi:hypothetical protein